MKKLAIIIAAVAALGSTAAVAQSWAWAVYANYSTGQILVANMGAAPQPASVWKPLTPYTHQSEAQSQAAACSLVAGKDLMGRTWTSLQISAGAWSC